MMSLLKEDLGDGYYIYEGTLGEEVHSILLGIVDILYIDDYTIYGLGYEVHRDKYSIICNKSNLNIYTRLEFLIRLEKLKFPKDKLEKYLEYIDNWNKSHAQR